MDALKKMWLEADEALAKARSLSLGPTRMEGLKEASRLRNEAVKAELALALTI